MPKYKVISGERVYSQIVKFDFLSTIALLLSMTKPRIVLSIVLTSLVGFILNPYFLAFPFWIAIALIISVASTTAGGAVLNHYLERETDKLMERTKNRPLPSGQLASPMLPLCFGGGLTVLGLLLCYYTLGIGSTIYLSLGAFSYVVVYTLWLKHRTIWNVPVGGTAGAFAVLVGTSVGDAGLTYEAVLLALILHFWSPAHFWNFAVCHRDEYQKAGIPQLPEVVGIFQTNLWIAFHTSLLILLTLGLVLYGSPGWLFGTIGLLLGLGFLTANLINCFQPSDKLSRINFIFSLAYLTFFFVGIILDFYFQLYF